MNTRFQIIGIGLLAAALTVPTGLAQTDDTTDYVMLPALENSSPSTAVLLDAADTGERLVAVGERGLITWSEDQGVSWQQASVPVSLTLTSVIFANPQQGWAAGHEGVILATRDGGLNWELQQTGRDTVEQSIPQLEAEIARLRQVLEETEDAEQKDLIAFDLEYVEFGLEDAQAALETGPADPLLDIWFKDENTGFAVGAYGSFLGTTDGGDNWQLMSRNLDNPDKLHLTRVAATEDGTLLLTGEMGTAFRSDDGGTSWEKMPVPYDGTLYGIISLGGDDLLVHGLRGNIFISHDRGDSWEAATSNSTSALVDGGKYNGNILLVGSSGAVLQSSDGGQQFEYRYHGGRSSLSTVAPLEGDALLLLGTDGVIVVDSFSQLESE